MKIIPIIDDESLLAIHNDEQHEEDEFTRLFESWDDAQYLKEFFLENLEDLKAHGYAYENLVEVLENVRAEAWKLEDKLLDIAESDAKHLDELFKPLHNEDVELSTHRASKAYGLKRKSWLRVYAIRMSSDKYVITGGAIKLTRRMEDRSHTKEQLLRLQQLRDKLREDGLTENDDLRYIDL